MSNSNKPELTAEQKKKANILCILSTVLGFPIPVIFCALCYFFEDNGMETLATAALTPAGFSLLAGVALMVIVRAKYSRSVFGKVLMILYIVMFLTVAAAAIYLFAACLTACSDPRW